MQKNQDDHYYKGYIAGYRDGMTDAASGKTAAITESDVINLPIKGMALSTRAYNCLARADCVYIADVAALSEITIATMRNLGPKTASEIAHWLDEHGIRYSAWSRFLQHSAGLLPISIAKMDLDPHPYRVRS